MLSCNKRFSIGAKDDKLEVEKASRIIIIDHYDTQLNLNYYGSNISNNNNSIFLSKQANAGICMRTVNNISYQVAVNANLNANPPKVDGCLCSHYSTLSYCYSKCLYRPYKY